MSLSAIGPETPEVLHNINLHIAAGQTVALVGPTGAGKSSIANLIARFYDATKGQVLIDGIDVRQRAAAIAAGADGHRVAGSVPLFGHHWRKYSLWQCGARRIRPLSQPPD